MKNPEKTKEQLLEEIDQLKVKIVELEMSAKGPNKEEEAHNYPKEKLKESELKMAENALHESTNRFEDLVDLLPEGIIEADMNFKLNYVNQRVLELSGYSKSDISAGLNGFELLIPEDRILAKENFALRLNALNADSP